MAEWSKATDSESVVRTVVCTEGSNPSLSVNNKLYNKCKNLK